MPGPFVELSRELAAEKGIDSGDGVRVKTARGEITMPAVVTERLRPFDIAGEVVHQVGMVWHFGYRGLAKGASANDLTPRVGDPNSMIPEFKAFLCDLPKDV